VGGIGRLAAIKREGTAVVSHASGGMQEDKPVESGSRSYTYNPALPVSTLGGNNLSLPAGPMN